MKFAPLLAAALLTAALHAAEPITLFNGKDLSGWKPDIPKADKNPDIEPSFIVRDGMLVSKGNPRGQLLTEKSFKNYKLVVEYRFPDKPGNCGVLVHASRLRARGNMHPQSIEVQMMSGDAGDFWVIKEDITVPDMEKRRPRKEGQKWGGGQNDARRILNLTDDSEKPLGEWNQLAIICKDDTITVYVNGDLANKGSKATATEGKIALQAEGAEVEFRKIVMYPLKD